jgi:DNA-nicking Smr family endonuclease
MFNTQTYDAKIDFHEFGEISREEVSFHFDQFIKENLALKNLNLLIITGKGQLIRPEVQSLLKGDKRVESFRSAGYFNGQTGAFEVKLRVSRI